MSCYLFCICRTLFNVYDHVPILTARQGSSPTGEAGRAPAADLLTSKLAPSSLLSPAPPCTCWLVSIRTLPTPARRRTRARVWVTFASRTGWPSRQGQGRVDGDVTRSRICLISRSRIVSRRRSTGRVAFLCFAVSTRSYVPASLSRASTTSEPVQVPPQPSRCSQQWRSMETATPPSSGT
jgi:hypothetical protein